jgi:hypothetical protein
VVSGTGHVPPATPIERVYELLIGAAAVGLGLGGLVDMVRGDHSAVSILPIWVWLVATVPFAAAALRGGSMPERLRNIGGMILMLSCAAVGLWPDTPMTLIGRSLCLGIWGGMAVLRCSPGAPSAVAQSALKIGVATASAGFLPGTWKIASLVALIVCVLVAVWRIDNLEAAGVIVGRTERKAG